ncbi:MAG: hypothetical protein QOE90_1612 [Thermoplasmata archaeon]|jgi:di/tricarboxylate transporter|nr:hypothetical protein [Thermoplasmata archaeon]
MAQLTIHGTWKSIVALACLVAFIGVVAYAVAAGVSLGAWPYLLVIATMVFGFWSREDHIAIGGIIGLSLLIVLDVVLRIGILAFNTCHGRFSMLSGC